MYYVRIHKLFYKPYFFMEEQSVIPITLLIMGSNFMKEHYAIPITLLIMGSNFNILFIISALEYLNIADHFKKAVPIFNNVKTPFYMIKAFQIIPNLLNP